MRVLTWASGALRAARCGSSTQLEPLDRRLTALERWVSMQPDLEDLRRGDRAGAPGRGSIAAEQDFEAATALRDKEDGAARPTRWAEKEWAARCWPKDSGQGTRPAEYELERLRATWREPASSQAATLHRRHGRDQETSLCQPRTIPSGDAGKTGTHPGMRALPGTGGSCVPRYLASYGRVLPDSAPARGSFRTL